MEGEHQRDLDCVWWAGRVFFLLGAARSARRAVRVR